jgi:sec-independent protein translocase protein TatC
MAAVQPNEDLFESTRMSFGEHLDELRKVLVRSVIGMALGCAVGFYYANQTVEFLTKPLTDAIGQFHVQQAEKRLVAINGFLDPESTPWLEQDNMAPETVYVDPGEFVHMLRQISPDFLSGVELNPYGFQAGHFDIEKLPELCRRLSQQTAPTEARKARLQWLWNQLDSTQQRFIIRISEAEVGTRQDVQTIVRIFDQLARSKELNSSQSFAGMVEKPPTSWKNFFVPPQSNPLVAVKQKLDENFDADLNRRLNRVLITSQFVDLMPEVRRDMVPIQMWSRIDVQPQSLTAIEPFLIWVKAGLILGLILSSPWVFYQLWSFVAAGLYPHEQKYIHIFLPVSLILFFGGVSLAFFFVFEPVLTFLFSFNAQMGISPQPRITEWLNFVLLLPVGFGIAFQLPLVMLFLNRIGIFDVSSYLSKWRVAILVIFVLSMVLTPADPISMILLAIPLTALYFFGVGLCQWLPRKENPFEASARSGSAT